MTNSQDEATAHTTNLQKDFDKERHRRLDVESQLERLREEIVFHKAEMAEIKSGVRYRLGDAFVRAAKPSVDTVKLPFRIAKLLFEGVGRVLWRRREGGADQSTKAPPAKKAADPYSIASLLRPFGSIPQDLRRRENLRIAAISDEFSWCAWNFEANLFTFEPETWRDSLESQRPDVVLIESAWRGVNNTWYYQLRQLGSRDEVSYVLPDIAEWCRSRKVPLVFYNKEDPPNYAAFIDAARQCDFVFTSDENCVEAYRKDLGHERVFSLPFAAQPRIHNPIAAPGGRSGSLCFAGTWYNSRHAQRQDDARNVLEPALKFDLDIFDRMADSRDAAYHWPKEFTGAIRGGLPYWKMVSTYKKYNAFLNVNSVHDSPTMFSRRVFELLACGTPVISSYSKGIDTMLGSDLVLMSKDQETTAKLLRRVLEDSEYRERLALRGQRTVFSEHTYSHRLKQILDSIGFETEALPLPTMTMLAAVNSPAEAVCAWENYNRQRFSQRRLILCAANASAVANVDEVTGSRPDVKVCVGQEGQWAKLLRDAIQTSDGDFFVSLRPRDYYGAYYLTDYANVTLYLREAAFGKASFHRFDTTTQGLLAQEGAEYEMCDEVNWATLCLRREAAITRARQVNAAKTANDWWSQLAQVDEKTYATDRFNYVESDPNSNPSGNAITDELSECQLDSVLA